MRNILKKFFIILLRAYQLLISPWLGKNCRFTPSCSQYSIEAFEKLPIHMALLKTVWRLLRCHPFNAGGYDPVIREEDQKNHKCNHDH